MNKLAKALRSDFIAVVPLEIAAEAVRRAGRGRDTILSHITPREATMPKRRGGKAISMTGSQAIVLCIAALLMLSSCNHNMAKAEEKLRPVEDIIWEVSKSRVPSHMTREDYLARFGTLIQQSDANLMQIGDNTVFLLLQRAPGVVQATLISNESAQDLPDRYRVAANLLRQMGQQEMVSLVKNNEELAVLQNTGLPLRVKKLPDGQYQVEIDLTQPIALPQ